MVFKHVQIALIMLIMCSTLLAQTASTKKYFLIGSSVQDVIAVLGMPSSYTPPDESNGRGFLYYGNAVITFDNRKVVKWKGFSPPKYSDNSAIVLTLGAPRTEVLFKLGFPPVAYTTLFSVEKPERTVYSEEVWEYPEASVTFLKGTLAGWQNAATLHVTIGEKQSDAKPIALGSNRDALRMAAGTPSALTPLTPDGYEIWQYSDDATVFLRNGLVSAWINYQGKLPILLTANPSAMKKIELGSSLENIIANAGTPQVLLPQTNGGSIWFYDANVIALDANNKVCELSTTRLNALLATRQSIGLDWPNYLGFIDSQPHLDYHDYIGLTDKEIYLFYHDAKSTIGKQTVVDPSTALRVIGLLTQDVYSNPMYRAGLQAALYPAAKDATLDIWKQDFTGSPAYKAGYAEGLKEINSNVDTTDAKYQQFRASYFVQIPDFIGKSSNEVSAVDGLQLEKITIVDADLPSGTIIDSYPNAGFYLQRQAKLTLYVNQ